MALNKKGKYWYGTTLEDTKAEMLKFSRRNGYEAVKFAEAVCLCGGRAFHLSSDEAEGAARRTCISCSEEKWMGDSVEYMDSAQLERHECVCEAENFQILSGVALYEGSNDVRWYYIGCLCTKCRLVGVFADWKCEAGDANEFLART